MSLPNEYVEYLFHYRGVVWVPKFKPLYRVAWEHGVDGDLAGKSLFWYQKPVLVWNA